MGVITTAAIAKALYPGVKTWYGQKYAEYPEEWPEIFKRETSERAFEEEVGLTGFGLYQQKNEGAGISFDAMSQAFITRYNMIVWGLGFIITREMIEDNLYKEIALKRAGALAFSARQTKEIIGANILNRGFTPGYVGGDGATLFSPSHPNKSGGAPWSNTPAVAADLSEASLEQACIDIANFKTDRGLKIAIKPQKIIIPPDLEFDCIRVLQSTLQASTANNALNAIKASGKIPNGYRVNHYLTDVNQWTIITDCPEGLKYFERRKDDFEMENDFSTENIRMKSTFRGAFGWTDPRCAYASPGA
jgi:hypothetical protein